MGLYRKKAWACREKGLSLQRKRLGHFLSAAAAAAAAVAGGGGCDCGGGGDGAGAGAATFLFLWLATKALPGNSWA